MEIRDNRLYRSDYATFEEYCRERWGWNRAHAYRQIDAAKVARTLSPIGDIPKNEAQARELVDLTPEQQISVAEQVDFLTATAKEVREVAEQVKSGNFGVHAERSNWPPVGFQGGPGIHFSPPPA